MILPVEPRLEVDFWTEDMTKDQADRRGWLFALLINPESGIPIKAFVAEPGGFIVAIPAWNYFINPTLS